jgi:hypothetical protein
MPLQATSGAASYDAFGGGAPVVNYIEDVFSTYLYTGTGAALTITNNIDLSTKGGMVWIKSRNNAVNHDIFDTARGPGHLSWITTAAESYTTDTQKTLTAFNADGFSLGTDSGAWGANSNGYTFASWTFRKQPKFFDIVTYTGTGSARSVSHNLGSTPGFVIVKRTDTTGYWYCNIVAFTGWTDYMVLNTTAARATDSTVWNSTSPTSTTFTVGTNAGVNASGGTYVAYLFADSAGGFGLTGSDSVISTTLVSSAGSGNTTVNLGWEPQFLMFKKTATTSDWYIYDTMRGMAYATGAATLLADTAGAETTGISVVPTATGFVAALDNSFTYFCLAIRRGPMKVPTSGTSVFAVADSAASFPLTLTSNFKVDAILAQRKTTNVGLLAAALTQRAMATYQQFNESDFGSVGSAWTWDKQTGLIVTDWGGAGNVVSYCLGRAPSFMDVCCYTGTGSNTTQTHNLGVVPELIVVKCRSVGNAWAIYSSALGNTKYLVLNTTAAAATGATWWNSTTPTSSVFSIGTTGEVNTSAATYVAYLFATCAGVSKVGSYTGTGTTLQIDCGFTAGARFIYIKRTDATGGWHVWDSARGIISGNDPYFLTNSTNAQVTGTDYIDPYSAGFEISSTAPAEINASGGTYIFLAIA